MSFLSIVSCQDVPFVNFMIKNRIPKQNMFQHFTDEFLRYKIETNKAYKNTIRYKYVLTRHQRKALDRTKRKVYSKLHRELKERELYAEFLTRQKTVRVLKTVCKTFNHAFQTVEVKDTCD